MVACARLRWHCQGVDILGVISAILFSGQGVSSTPPQTTVDRFVRGSLHVLSYDTAQADLNGDGRPEIFVYANRDCGSGGCDLYILTSRSKGWRVVMKASVTRPPIRVLPTATRGWHDVGVFVAGGGIISGYTARLRFDGRHYPGNPTVPPATRVDRPTGRVMIGR